MASCPATFAPPAAFGEPPRVSVPLRVLSFAAAMLALGQLLLLPEPAFAQQAKEAFSDSLVHAVVFGGLALLLWAALGGRSALPVFAAVMAIGALDESLQYFTPGRQADLLDLLANASGAAAALIAARILSSASPPGRGQSLTPHGG